jgi:hypothetical protein
MADTSPPRFSAFIVPGWTAVPPVLFQEVDSCCFAEALQALRVDIRFQATATSLSPNTRTSR